MPKVNKPYYFGSIRLFSDIAACTGFNFQKPQGTPYGTRHVQTTGEVREVGEGARHDVVLKKGGLTASALVVESAGPQGSSPQNAPDYGCPSYRALPSIIGWPYPPFVRS